MRVAIVSPYSWTYPGGVNRHIEALAAQLAAGGPRGARAGALGRGHARDRAAPSWRAPASRSRSRSGSSRSAPRSAGRPTAPSRTAPRPSRSARGLRRELARGGLRRRAPARARRADDRLGRRSRRPTRRSSARSTATRRASRRTRSRRCSARRRKLNHLTRRIAVSEAAAWTGRRFYGGEYTIVPNGVELPEGGVPVPRLRLPGQPLEIAFVGQAVERKGLPILLRAFEALREHEDVRLTIVGANEPEVAPMLVERDGVTVLGRVSDERKRARARVRARARRAVAGRRVVRHGPHRGLRGRARPVVASDIAGYRDVVRDGVDGSSSRAATRSARRARCAGSRTSPRARPRSAPARPRAPSATPGRRSPRRSPRSTRRPGRCPQPEGDAGELAVRTGMRSAGLEPHARGAPAARRSSRRCRAATAPAPRCAAARWAPRRVADGRRLLPRAGAHRRRPDRPLAARLEPDLGARRARADVPLDGLPRRLLARDPQGRAARRCARGSPTPGRARRSAC